MKAKKVQRSNRVASDDGLERKCRCYINARTYSKAASKGGNMDGYKPCPVHELRSN